MPRNTWLMAISLSVIIVLLSNAAYYFLTKKTLEDALNHEMRAVARQIEFSVEQSRLGAEKFQDQIGRELRIVSIAAQYALDPDVEKVTNEQLKELSAKLGVEHITLLKRTEDNIILYKSSDENELGKGTKTWDPWYVAFNQLFDNKQVSIDWLGQALPNFWSGPFEVASTDPDSIYKWGYYYDGTTNYIIDPYVNYTALAEYEKLTGINELIDKSIGSSDSLLEATVINPMTFGKGSFDTVNEDGEIQGHLLQKDIFYGTYRYKSDRDVEYVRKAYNTGENISVKANIDGKHVLKMFIPVTTGDEVNLVNENGEPIHGYVLSLVSDYQVIQDRLDSQFLNIAIVIFLVTGISILIVAFAMQYFRQSREKVVVVTQQTYVDEINSMFQSIRAQRHDFLNHVQTIHSLAELNKSKELVAYTKELTGEIRLMNDIINIGNPAIAALIRSKISQAESCRIAFTCSFSGLNRLEMGIKTLDVNRMLGNLIDNAFDEVMKYGEECREVELTGSQMDGFIEFCISNTCANAHEIKEKPLFEAGFSTKDDAHQGLGLYTVKSITEQYKGTIQVNTEIENKITFYIRIPH
ncbi:Sensor_kinase_SpoOB-type, alpha-helical domain [Paenibacillus catalpae]|uniref:Sensor_kinase_SpoOB-type, alpha-helical domain n=1 Tax=Paenibacillus catalpae TaxID=1045775 RepID=A0A1I2AX91_9BACL|nr:GHKL domain-containing protein [Paenibacillus catalpae]SFE48532.1 Sensor_kinase_SpoOB-type, alpha-helical domain [Paenibacillus catalpae]